MLPQYVVFVKGFWMVFTLDLAEAGDKELGYLPGKLVFIPHPEMVSSGYNFTLLGFGDVLEVLLELCRWYDEIVLTADKELGHLVSL